MKQMVTIRPEKPVDYPEIYKVHQKAFRRSDESDLIGRLRESKEYISDLALVAVNEAGTVVGHILFTKVTIKGKQVHPSLALAPMAVLPDFQKTGIGSRLVQTGLDRAEGLGYPSVVVLGHKSYYPKFGFRPASVWGISCPFEVPDEVFMALELKGNALSDAPGVVEYSPAFNIN